MSGGGFPERLLMRILLVEDNEDNRDMLARRLTRKGHEVEIAINGQEALNALSQARPDIVLMDVSMPVMSGLEATEIIRQTPDISDLKIIALTAHAMEQDKERCIQAGCDAFATKPVDFKALMDLIGSLTGDARLSA